MPKKPNETTAREKAIKDAADVCRDIAIVMHATGNTQEARAALFCAEEIQKRLLG